MLKTKLVIISVLAVLSVFFFGCGDNNVHVRNEGSQTMEKNAEDPHEEAIKLMMENYHLDRDDLEDLDVEALIRDYGFDEIEYTAEEVYQILEDNREYYVITEESRLFSMLNPPDEIPESEDLKKDDDITEIGFYENPGSLQRYVLFDLKDKAFYVDDVTPHPLSEAAVNSLKDIGKNTSVCEWEHITNGYGGGSTGSYAWKLVFLLKDGRKCIYGGDTDGSTLPKGYDDVLELLNAYTK